MKPNAKANTERKKKIVKKWPKKKKDSQRSMIWFRQIAQLSTTISETDGQRQHHHTIQAKSHQKLNKAIQVHACTTIIEQIIREIGWY
uniref:Uncharacterized protein n=1 Tax=Rhizophora mucronata TaxID=61149 RepID=A0A2P2KRB9_RHIMU